MYLLDRLSDMRHLLGNKEVTTGTQVGRWELERLTIGRASFFISTRKSSSILIFLHLLQNLGFMSFSCLYLFDFLFLEAVYNVSGFYLSFPFTNKGRKEET